VYVHAVLEKKSLTDDAENEALEKHGSLQWKICMWFREFFLRTSIKRSVRPSIIIICV
jgi:hypothetical protein